MILKVAAPFRLPEFGLRTDRIAETPDRYAEAWKEVRDAWQARDVLALDPSASEPRSSVSAVRFSHATHGRPPGQSRYRTISDHDLERPIHFLELELSTPEGGMRELLAAVSADVEGSASVMDAFRRPPSLHLARIFGWRIGMLEADMGLDEAAMRRLIETPGSVEVLRRVAIKLTERLVDEFARVYARRLRASLNEFDVAAFMAAPEGPAPGASRTMWVTRSLVFLTEDQIESDVRERIAIDWVADIPEHDPAPARDGDEHTQHEPAPATGEKPDEADRIDLSRPEACSMIWLNYVFREASYPGDYPTRGWRLGREPGGVELAQPFFEGWDGMLIAQYYYAAFEELQVRISGVLARVLIDGDSDRRTAIPELNLDESRKQLNAVIRLAHLLDIEYEENRKYLARRVLAKVDRIFANWRFQTDVRTPLNRRLEAAKERITRLQERRRERAQVRTDMIFVFIGVAAFLTILMDAEQYYLKTGDAPIKLIVGGALVFFSILPLFLYIRTSQRLSAE